MIYRWRINMLGGLTASQGSHTISKFQTQKAGLLLAYLAYFADREHSREKLMAYLWPEADVDVQRNRFKQALWSLRRQFEPPGTPSGSVIVADRLNVKILASAITIDVAEFEAGLRRASLKTEATEKCAALAEACSLYHGEFLAGYYEEWVQAIREGLCDSYLVAAAELAEIQEQSGQLGEAIETNRKLLAIDPYREATHCAIMRIYLKKKENQLAVKQYEVLEKTLKEHLGETPSESAKELLAATRQQTVQTSTNIAQVSADTQQAPTSGTHKLAARLPVQFSNFFGRESELESIEKHLKSGQRITTLFGPGGCGKTRLAVEVGERLRDWYSEAVWFVPLADLTDAWMIPDAILGVLQKDKNFTLDVFDQISRSLRQVTNGNKALLIFDNYEHLAEEGAIVVRRLLESNPPLQCMITSRHRLNLEGEVEVPISPLPVPNEDDNSPEKILPYASVQMFRDRAQATRAYFQITPRNAVFIRKLCERLEGIPLAIELAAKWIQTLTPAQMLDQLQLHSNILTSRRKDQVDRHRSLNAALEYSYVRLLPEQQRFLCLLSAFQGGWDLDAAAYVASQMNEELPAQSGWQDQALVLEHMTGLIERSLISSINTENERYLRYRMLETIREFAWGKLSDELHVRLLKVHFEYFLRLSEEAAQGIRGPDQVHWFERVGEEHENIRAALKWALENDPVSGIKLVNVLFRYWYTKGYLSEGVNWFESFGEKCKNKRLGPEIRALFHSNLGVLHWRVAHYQKARENHKKSLRLYKQMGDEHGMAQCYFHIGILEFRQANNPAALKALTTALEISERVGALETKARVLLNLGNIRHDAFDWKGAKEFYEKSLEVEEQIQNDYRKWPILGNLALTCLSMGDFAGAKKYVAMSVALNNQYKLKPFEGNIHRINISIYLKEGLIVDAAAEFMRALRIYEDMDEIVNVMELFDRAVYLAYLNQDYFMAMKFLEGANALMAMHGCVRTTVEQYTVDENRQLLKEKVSQEQGVRAAQEIQGMSEGEILTLLNEYVARLVPDGYQEALNAI